MDKDLNERYEQIEFHNKIFKFLTTLIVALGISVGSFSINPVLANDSEGDDSIEQRVLLSELDEWVSDNSDFKFWSSIARFFGLGEFANGALRYDLEIVGIDRPTENRGYVTVRGDDPTEIGSARWFYDNFMSTDNSDLRIDISEINQNWQWDIGAQAESWDIWDIFHIYWDGDQIGRPADQPETTTISLNDFRNSESGIFNWEGTNTQSDESIQSFMVTNDGRWPRINTTNSVGRQGMNYVGREYWLSSNFSINIYGLYTIEQLSIQDLYLDIIITPAEQNDESDHSSLVENDAEYNDLNEYIILLSELEDWVDEHSNTGFWSSILLSLGFDGERPENSGINMEITEISRPSSRETVTLRGRSPRVAGSARWFYENFMSTDYEHLRIDTHEIYSETRWNAGNVDEWDFFFSSQTWDGNPNQRPTIRREQDSFFGSQLSRARRDIYETVGEDRWPRINNTNTSLGDEGREFFGSINSDVRGIRSINRLKIYDLYIHIRIY